ncbi:MAG: hypothetical protein J4203_02855 [Candidatus Diapherotrites archaeon]|uniref:PIN domain-containing protein n=1 Tax=Candidatus Iainarchaeum sp. TaxID=3101447 RepID=A0A8T4L7Y0_9ARCH|nr:hypothetical protein [Candidatus Diapherotrites archaeon]
MRAVVDANILLSALLKDSITRKPLLDPRHSFLAPEHLLVEFSRHLQTDRECAKKIKVGKEQAQQVAGSLLAALTAVPEKEYAAFLPQALRLAAHGEDAPYLALALARKLPLWSYDKGFRKQHRVKVLSVSDLLAGAVPAKPIRYVFPPSTL